MSLAAKPSLMVDAPAELFASESSACFALPNVFFSGVAESSRTATDSSTGLVGQQAQAAQPPAAGAALGAP